MKLWVIAIAVIGLAAAEEPDWEARGRAEFTSGQLRSAKASFGRAVQAAGSRTVERAVSLASLAQTLLNLGELTAAADAIDQASVLLPNSATIWHIRGQVAFRQGDRTTAEADLRKALLLAASEPRVTALCLNDLAALLAESKRTREALTLLEQAAASAKAGQARARILSNISLLQWKLGQKRESVATQEKALSEMESAVGDEHPDIARILEEYAWMLARSGRKPESRTAAEKALRMKAAFAWQANASSAAIDWRDLR